MKMRIVSTPAGECLGWRDPEFGPWLLGHEVLRDVEAAWPNEVDKRRIEFRRGGKEKACACFCRWWRGGEDMDSMCFFFLATLYVLVYEYSYFGCDIFAPRVNQDCIDWYCFLGEDCQAKRTTPSPRRNCLTLMILEVCGLKQGVFPRSSLVNPKQKPIIQIFPRLPSLQEIPIV